MFIVGAAELSIVLVCSTNAVASLNWFHLTDATGSERSVTAARFAKRVTCLVGEGTDYRGQYPTASNQTPANVPNLLDGVTLARYNLRREKNGE